MSSTPPPDGDWLGTRFVRFERRGSIGIATVDRPHRRNALTATMYFALRYAVDHVNRSDDLAALVITGVGDVFIPGGDLSAEDEEEWLDIGKYLHNDSTPFEAIRNSPKPVVSAVNGICFAGGLLIAMLSDVSVASTTATFSAPEVFRGIADTGYTTYLPGQVGIGRARDMMLTGRVLSAQEGLEWGLITRLCEPGQELDEAIALARRIVQGAPRARMAVTREINKQYGYQDKMTMNASLLVEDEFREGFLAFKERRNPTWVPEDLRTEGRV